jgi:hypothetical protein
MPLCPRSTPDYATPQDQQFSVDYDLAMRPDQESRSPAGSPAPVRNIKRTRRLAGGSLGAAATQQQLQQCAGRSDNRDWSQCQQQHSLPVQPLHSPTCTSCSCSNSSLL